MKSNFLHVILITMITMLFVACGGGSSYAPADNTESNNTDINITGVLIDSLVVGAKYTCGTDTNSLYTNTEGKFSCPTFPITFYVGNIKLGTITSIASDKEVHIQDLVGVDRNDTNNSTVIKIARLLQSLNESSDVNTSIVISLERNNLFTESIDITDFNLSRLTDKDSSIVIVSESEAIAHLHLTNGTTVSTTPDNNGTAAPDIQSKGTAVAQKGPFSKGSLVTAYQLNSDGSRIESTKTTTTTSDDTGLFAIEITWTGLTELHIEGTYLNEISGKYLNDGNLSTIIDMKSDEDNEVGINILTNMKSQVVIGKMEINPSGNFLDFEEDAKNLITEQFNLDESLSFGTLDVTKKDNAGNAQLLQLSAALLGTDDPEEILKELVEALKNSEDGELDEEGIAPFEKLQEASLQVDLAAVVSKLNNNLEGVTVEDNLENFKGELRLGSRIRFTRINNAFLDTNYTSEMVTINGIIGDVPTTLSLDKGWYKINGGSPSQTDTTIKNGDTLELILTAANDYSIKEISRVKIGKKKIRFVVKTISDAKLNDGKPDKFTFGSKRDVPFNTEVISDIMNVTGINVDAKISIDSGLYSINGGEYTATDGTVKNEDNITVKLRTSSAFGEKLVTRVTIGTESSGTRTGKFVVRTESRDRTPAIVGSFDAVAGADQSTAVTSNQITVTDINVPVKIKITGAEFSIDGGAFQSTASTIINGQKVNIKATSSTDFDTEKEFFLNIGRIVVPFSVKTKSNPITPDTTVDAFSFDSLRTLEASIAVESEVIVVASINEAVPISITNGEYRIGTGSYTSTAGTVNEGDNVQVRVTSAAHGSEQIASLDIGGVSAKFKVETIKDETPVEVFFIPQLNVLKDSQIESNTVTISGINVPIPVTVISGGEYSIDGGSYGSTSGTIENNQTLRVRLTSSNAPASPAVSVIKVGQMPLTFVTITQDDAPKFQTSIVVPNATEDLTYKLELKTFLDEGEASSWSMIGNPTWLTINPLNGRLLGTPTGNETVGSATITVTAKNATGESSVTFNLTVDDVNYPPVLVQPTNITKDEDSATFTIGLNSSDKDNTVATYSAASSDETKVTVSVSGSVLTLTPLANAHGTVNITVTVTDVLGVSDSETFTLTLDAVNDKPELVAISAQTVLEDAPSPLILTLSSTDVDNDNIIYSAVSSDESIATVTVSDSQLTVTPIKNATGDVTITVTANDGTVDSNVETFVVSITAVNDAPEISSTALITATEDVEYTYIATATDIENDSLTWTMSGEPTGMTINARTGAITWTPLEGVTTSGTVTITVTDSGEGTLTDTQTFTISVTAVNDAPVLAPISSQTMEEDASVPLTITLSSTDEEDDAISYSAVSSDETKATVSISGSDLSITPVANMFGLITVTVTANDGTEDSEVETFTVTITAVNDAPTIVESSIFTTAIENNITTTQLELEDVDLNDTHTWEITSANPPSWLTLDSSGKLTANPASSDLGNYTVSITVTDNANLSSTLEVTIVVSDTPDTPVAVNDTASVVEDENLSIDVLSNDTDEDTGDTKTIKSVTVPQNGTATIVNGQVLYVPNLNFNGEDTFSYTMNDSADLEATATVTVTVTAVNDVPTIDSIDFLSATSATLIDEDSSALTLDVFAVDVDEDALTYEVESSDSTKLEVSMNDNKLTITPLANQNGLVTVTVTVTDGTESVSETYDIDITAVNDAPILNAISARTVEEEASAISVELNATDVDADTLSYSATSSDETKATVIITGSILTITPLSDANGEVIISVTANDGTENSNVESLTLTINPVNDAPILIADDIPTKIQQDTAIDVTLSATDVDEGDTHTFSMTGNPGWLSIDSSGHLSGTPTSSDIGIYSNIEVIVTDSGDGRDSFIFSIEVIDVNDAPTIEGTPETNVSVGTAYSFTPTANDVDVNNTLIFTVSGQPSWLELNETTGELYGTPMFKDIGDSEIILGVSDEINTTSLTPFTLTVFDDTNLTAQAVTLPVVLSQINIRDEYVNGNITKVYTYEETTLADNLEMTTEQYVLELNGTSSNRIDGAVLSESGWVPANTPSSFEVNDNFIDIALENMRVAVIATTDISNQIIEVSGLTVSMPTGASKFTLAARAYGETYRLYSPRVNQETNASYDTLDAFVSDVCEQKYLSSKADTNFTVGLVMTGCNSSEVEEGVLIEAESNGTPLNSGASVGKWMIKTVNGVEMLVIYPSVTGYATSEDRNESRMYAVLDNGEGAKVWEGNEEHFDGTVDVFEMFNDIALIALKQKMIDALLGIEFRFTREMLANQNTAWFIYSDLNETTGESSWNGITFEFTESTLQIQTGILGTVDSPEVQTDYNITDRGQLVFVDDTINYLTIVDMTESNITICWTDTAVPTCDESNYEFLYLDQTNAQSVLDGLNASAVRLPSGFVNKAINNTGNGISFEANGFILNLYSNETVASDTQAKHVKVAIKIDGVTQGLVNIIETYKGKSMIASVKSTSENRLVLVSESVVIREDGRPTTIDIITSN